MSELNIKEIEAGIARIEKAYNKADGEVAAMTRVLAEVKARAKKKFGVTKAAELRELVATMKVKRTKLEKQMVSKKGEIDKQLELLAEDES